LQLLTLLTDVHRAVKKAKRHVQQPGIVQAIAIAPC
jgi:hypothetical protein